MKRIILTTMLLKLLLVAGCASFTPVFPDITISERVWVDIDGNYYSAVQDTDGDFTIHDVTSGRFFYYRNHNGQIKGRPAGAPDIAYKQKNILLGDKILTSANLISERFEIKSDGAIISGLLIMPDSEKKVPVIISGQGSESSSAIAFDWSSSWYIQAGYGTVIFDKRGTGSSGGEFTHNFTVLAKDMNTIVEYLLRHPRVDHNLIGIAGNSQSVRVATLAASQNPDISFIVASYGTIGTAVDDEMQLTKKKFNDQYPELSWSDFSPFVMSCISAFALEQDEHWSIIEEEKAHWLSLLDPDKLEGTQVGDGCLSWPIFILKSFGRSKLPSGLDWSYDPSLDIESLNIPIMWLFGEADDVAPSEASIRKVKSWITKGKPFEVKTYEGANHGMYLLGGNETVGTYRYKHPQYIKDIINWLIELKN